MVGESIAVPEGIPTSDLDLWSTELLNDPYPAYKALRDAGSAVWLNQHHFWAITRYSSVREALLNADAFTSTAGVSMNPEINRASKGLMLTTDDPEHRRLRRVFIRPLTPAAVSTLRDRLTALAEERSSELLALGEFDAVTQLAHYLPLTVVTELLGLSPRGRQNMLQWAAALFNAQGPENYPLTLSGAELGREAFSYLANLQREELTPEGWAAALFRAADQGELSQDEARAMLLDYTAPALDTTINGLSSALWLLGHHPTQWDLLRDSPQLVDSAIAESLRMETPIRWFSRVLTREYSFDGIALPQGSRALMLYGCANRDERRYANPDTFDIARDARDHIAFGYGIHSCAGMHLAKLEIRTVLAILVRKVKRFHIVEEQRELNNSLRGLSRLIIRVEPA
jgi:cytochrome P450